MKYSIEMKKMNLSLLANFIELITVLIQTPLKQHEKIDDLELLFLNLHNIINDYRPHQVYLIYYA